jgi:hypothetical protein
MFVLRHIGIRVHQRVKNVKMEIFVFHMLGFILFFENHYVSLYRPTSAFILFNDY